MCFRGSCDVPCGKHRQLGYPQGLPLLAPPGLVLCSVGLNGRLRHARFPGWRWAGGGCWAPFGWRSCDSSTWTLCVRADRSHLGMAGRPPGQWAHLWGLLAVVCPRPLQGRSRPGARPAEAAESPWEVQMCGEFPWFWGSTQGCCPVSYVPRAFYFETGSR